MKMGGDAGRNVYRFDINDVGYSERRIRRLRSEYVVSGMEFSSPAKRYNSSTQQIKQLFKSHNICKAQHQNASVVRIKYMEVWFRTSQLWSCKSHGVYIVEGANEAWEANNTTVSLSYWMFFQFRILPNVVRS